MNLDRQIHWDLARRHAIVGGEGGDLLANG